MVIDRVEQVKEIIRQSRKAAWVDALLRDIHYTVSQIQRNPGFVAVATLTLALGIGANTAIFSIVDAVLLRPLPYKNPDRLVRIVENIPAAESISGAPERTTMMSPEAFIEWRSRTQTLSAMAMLRDVAKILHTRENVHLYGMQVSPALFQILRVQPVLGRTFEPKEEEPGFDKRIILSYATWQRFFAGDPQILGTSLPLDDGLYTVVGVMPRDFAYPGTEIQVWMPLSLPLSNLLGLPVIARVKDGITVAAAAEEAAAIGRFVRAETAQDVRASGPPRIQLMTLQEELVQPIRLPFLIFVISVVFVLLVACVNVANLFLARAATRSGEFRIRMALGAGRGMLLRQLLTEHFILASLGGVAGIAVGFSGTRVFRVLGQSLPRADLIRMGLTGNAIPRLNEAALSTSALLLTLALTIVAGVLFGLVPALQLRRYSIYAGPKHFRRLRALMVTVQVGLTFVLLVGAGLLIRTFLALATTNIGYDPANVLTFRVPQPALEYPKDSKRQKQQNAFAEEVVRRLKSVPGVQEAAFTNALPLVQGFWSWIGDAPKTQVQKQEGRSAVVSSDYFKAMGIRIAAGRSFTEADMASGRAVYVVNRAAVKDYFQGVNPIGKTISTFAGSDHGEIVGIVDDTRQSGPEAEPPPQIFMHPEHINDAVWGEGYYFVVRSTKEAPVIVPLIRAIIREIDPAVAVDDIATMDQIVSNSITTPRSYAVLLGTFSAVALALACIGLYGTLSYFVRQYNRELGIRVALGARKRTILRLVLAQGLSISAGGLILGLAGATALTRYMHAMLFGVRPLDPATIVLVTAFFLAVTLLASYIPARHATTVDPMTVLRHE